MSITHKIGIRIKELRSVRGNSQEALAHLAELDRTYINSVENGKAKCFAFGTVSAKTVKCKKIH